MTPKDTIRTKRIINNFNFNHDKEGGFARLETMLAAEPPATLRELGDYFGVSAQSIGATFEKIYGLTYGEYLRGKNIVRQGV
jgi:hypothetical protein